MLQILPRTSHRVFLKILPLVQTDIAS